MNTIIVKTYIKKLNKSGINSDDFFSIDSEEDVRMNATLFSGNLIYVEGAIIMEIYGKNLLSFEHYDYPFWLWGQIHNQLKRISAGEDFEVPFLETSRTLKVQSISLKNYQVNLLSSDNIEFSISVLKKDFLKPLIYSAIQSYTLADRYQKGEYRSWIKEFENVYRILTIPGK